MTLSIPDRAIVITGAGSGIGRATAQTVARPDTSLVLVGRRRAALEATAAELPDGTPVRIVVADLATPEGAADLASATIGLHLTGLALLAGGLEGESDLPGLAGIAESWIGSYRANVLTAVLAVEALKPQLADGASIVATSSIAAATGGGSYGAAKAALTPWMRDLARTLGPRNITANLIAPGFTEDTEFFGTAMTSARRQRLIDATMSKRAGIPEDVAATIAFLLSPVSRHITGQVIHINGGALLAG